MMRFVDNINSISPKQWKLLLEKSKTRSFFQTRACYDLYAANPTFMSPFCFAVEDNEALVCVLVGFIQRDGGRLKQFFSRRAIVNSGPMMVDDISGEALSLLLHGTRQKLKNKAIFIEIRNFEDYSQHRDIFVQCGFNYVSHLNFHIDTTSEDIVNKNLGKSRKRDIRTSFRDGAEIVENPKMKDIHQFYDILNNLYTTKVKTPLYPMSFFEHLFLQPYAKFLLVQLNGKIIGGTVCVTLPGHAVYEWFACGEDGVYKNIYPSTVATYAAIQYAANNGYHHFDMMGAGKPDENYGVRDFKAKFGGQLVEHGRFLNIIKPLLYEVGKFGVKIMKKK